MGIVGSLLGSFIFGSFIFGLVGLGAYSLLGRLVVAVVGAVVLLWLIPVYQEGVGFGYPLVSAHSIVCAFP